MPAPASLQVHVTCIGYSSPATVTLGLGPHTSPTLAGSSCYGKPIYAMADGTVADFLDTMVENTKMGK